MWQHDDSSLKSLSAPCISSKAIIIVGAGELKMLSKEDGALLYTVNVSMPYALLISRMGNTGKQMLIYYSMSEHSVYARSLKNYKVV